MTWDYDAWKRWAPYEYEYEQFGSSMVRKDLIVGRHTEGDKTTVIVKGGTLGASITRGDYVIVWTGEPVE